jgi:hypothetical protein
MRRGDGDTGAPFPPFSYIDGNGCTVSVTYHKEKGYDIPEVTTTCSSGCLGGWNFVPVPFGPGRCVPGRILGDFAREPRDRDDDGRKRTVGNSNTGNSNNHSPTTITNVVIPVWLGLGPAGTASYVPSQKLLCFGGGRALRGSQCFSGASGDQWKPQRGTEQLQFIRRIQLHSSTGHARLLEFQRNYSGLRHGSSRCFCCDHIFWVHTVLRFAMQPLWFLAGWAAATIISISTGTLLALNPVLFVRILRRIAIGDYYIKGEESEKRVASAEGRIAGFFFLCLGLLFLYLWLKAIHATK